ncbi:hypothetical protein AVEN_249996-1, partial [Araneus ventricosus]
LYTAERILLVQHVFRGKNSAGAACVQRKEFCWCSMHSEERILLVQHVFSGKNSFGTAFATACIQRGKNSACVVSVPTRIHVSAKHPKYKLLESACRWCSATICECARDDYDIEGQRMLFFGNFMDDRRLF